MKQVLCPGQDTRYWRADDIFEVSCGVGHVFEVELAEHLDGEEELVALSLLEELVGDEVVDDPSEVADGGAGASVDEVLAFGLLHDAVGSSEELLVLDGGRGGGGGGERGGEAERRDQQRAGSQSAHRFPSPWGYGFPL